MFQKLRIKFIAIIMASVAIVLAVVFAGICMTEYQRSLSDVQSALNVAIDRAVLFSGDGGFPDGQPQDGEPHKPDGKRGFQKDEGNENATGEMRHPSIGGRGDDHMHNPVPLAVYSSYEGETPSVVLEVTTASIDSDVLDDAFAIVQAGADGQGTLDELGLHYSRRTVDENVFMAFADSSNTSNWQSLAVTLAFAGLGTLAVFFIISLFLSRWALRPVREAWDSQRRFIADASHDLKTPLTVILANSSILLKHPDQSIASNSQWIESTQTEADRMQGLVAEMLELAQVEERAQMAHEIFDFSDMVDGESLQFESLAFEQGCLFDCNIEEGISVNGDAERLRKMVSTLIENALKYVDPNGTVAINLSTSSKRAHLSIRNTGPAIAAEDLPHIFDRFYRSDKARSSETGGFGLGLAIARETARAHDGDITCTSTEAEGTTFTVMLPLA